MGSFSPTIASNPTSQNSGKGGSIGSGPRGDFGDPNFDKAIPILQGTPAQMTDGQFDQMPSNNAQFEGTLGGNNVSPAVMPIGQYQQPMGKGGASTNTATSGQPKMGNPQDQADMYQPQRRFPNTIQPWDNAQIKTQTQSGKGKGQ